jgi:REP element-mobilizing transposase RayT
MKNFYRRNLPHFQPSEGEFFVTFRLAGSLPVEVIRRLKEERESRLKKLETVKDIKQRAEMIHKEEKIYFGKFDELLDNPYINSPQWLKYGRVAKTVADRLHDFDNNRYELICYCIMSNHVHLLFKLLNNDSNKVLIHKDKTSKYIVTDIMRLIKGSTARQSNEILKRTGDFWHNESYDHLIRSDKERISIFYYILENPVKAKLVNNWKDWKWTYCNSKYFPV